MSRHLRIRIALVAVVVAVSLWYLYPPRKTINLGLDLQGGIHLVLGVDVDKALEAHVERAGDTVRAELQKKGITVSKTERHGPGELVVQLASTQSWEAALQTVGEVLPAFDRKEADQAAGRIALTLKPREASEIKTLAVRQGLETIRNRIDQFGVSEASIQQQGDNRILVQLPGVQDPARAKALIGKTALLEFKLVDEKTDPETALRAGVPEGDEILYQRRVDKQTKEER
ncbi:MAG TPA: protein translocase subunit SecD, partial [Methylomirabilota bacterium]